MRQTQRRNRPEKWEETGEIQFFILMEFCLQVFGSLYWTKIFGSEEAALPEAILKQVKRRTSREYLRDRQGFAIHKVMKDFDENRYIIRSKETANLKK